MKKLALLLLAIAAFGPAPARAFIHHGVGGGSGGQAPFVIDEPQILGTDFPQAGTSVPLTLDTGAWNNSPLSYSCNWHFVGGSSLGTSCAGITLDTTTGGVLGSALQVDVTASNLAGSSTVRTHWFGPIEAAAPILPVQQELSAIPALGSGSLPVEPAHFLQNGHAVFPGCAIPPKAPANTATTGDPTHVWYFDPVNGRTQYGMTDTGLWNGGSSPSGVSGDGGAVVAASLQGHVGHPFKDITAIFVGLAGYNPVPASVITAIGGGTPADTPITVSALTALANADGKATIIPVLFGRTLIGSVLRFAGSSPGTVHIAYGGSTTITSVSQVEFDRPLWAGLIVPGDTIYVEPGSPSQPLGALATAGNYSTSDYTNTGTIDFTWIEPDPAASSLPVLTAITVAGNSTAGGNSGFIFKNFSVESYRNSGLVSVSGGQGTDSHDILLEHLRVSQWLGHSNDPWYPSNYPNTEGSSDGTVLTASPTFAGGNEDNTFYVATGAAHATVVNMATIPPIGAYAWSPGQIYNGAFPTAPSTGIPPGTIVTAINGLTAANYTNAGGAVNALLASQLTANTLAGSQTAITNLPQSAAGQPSTGTYWLVAANANAVQTVYAWDTNRAYIYWPNIPANGDTFTINGTSWQWTTGTPGTNQVLLVLGNLTASLNNAVAALNTAMSSTATFSNQTNSTLAMVWTTPGSNFVVVSNTTNSFSYSWASVGTIPPSVSSTANLVLLATINNHVLHWNGSSWDDLGTPTMTIAPCDPVNDHATGCPAAFSAASLGLANVPGCDPYVTYPGGSSSGGLNNGACTGGTPVAWNGLTRALTGENINFTPSMTITPAGYWNYADWDGDATTGILFSGTAGATQVNPSEPNNVVGVYCNSSKDNIVRDGAFGISATRAYDIVIYNSKTKYMSVDASDAYLDNRVWFIKGLNTDTAFLWGHQDFIQWGTIGATLAANLFGNAAIENLGVQYTDTSNYFPREMQGITTTENIHWNMYVCCNIMISSTDGITIDGHYNAIVQNDTFPGGVVIGNQPKSGETSAIYSLLGNNIGNSIHRQVGNGPAWTPNFCTPLAGDFSTVEGNMSIPGAGLTAAPSSLTCTSAGTITSTGFQGNWEGINQWASTIDWQSGAGVSPLFNAYHPLAAPVEPNPGWTTVGALAPFNLCLVVPNLYPPGTCSPTANGSIDLRPNSSFSGFTSPIVATLPPGNSTGEPFDLPTGQAVGAYAIASTTGTSGIVYPAGLWQQCPTGSGAGGCPTYSGSNPYIAANGWYFISASIFNPPIINAGTNLGAQQPITDLLGNAWNNPPSIGALQ